MSRGNPIMLSGKLVGHTCTDCGGMIYLRDRGCQNCGTGGEALPAPDMTPTQTRMAEALARQSATPPSQQPVTPAAPKKPAQSEPKRTARQVKVVTVKGEKQAEKTIRKMLAAGWSLEGQSSRRKAFSMHHGCTLLFPVAGLATKKQKHTLTFTRDQE